MEMEICLNWPILIGSDKIDVITKSKQACGYFEMHSEND